MPRKPRPIAGRTPTNKLTMLARDRGMTLAKLAKKVGLQASTVHAYANNGVPPSTVRDFAAALGVPMTDIPVAKSTTQRATVIRKNTKVEVPLDRLTLEELRSRIGTLADAYRAKRDALTADHARFMAQHSRNMAELEAAEASERQQLHAELDARVEGITKLAASLKGSAAPALVVPTTPPTTAEEAKSDG